MLRPPDSAARSLCYPLCTHVVKDERQQPALQAVVVYLSPNLIHRPAVSQQKNTRVDPIGHGNGKATILLVTRKI